MLKNIVKSLFTTPEDKARQRVSQIESEVDLPTKTITPFLIYVVDDSLLFLKIISAKLEGIEQALRNEGYNLRFTVMTFTTGDELLRALHQKPDLIVLDYFLDPDPSSDNNGDRVYEEIMRRDRSQKVVMMSSQNTATLVHRMVKAGLRDYIIKDEEAYSQLHELIREMAQKNRTTWVDPDLK